MAGNNKREQTHFPPAMLDMGMPAEMSPIEQSIDAYDEAPALEVTQPIPVHEMNEIEVPESI